MHSDEHQGKLQKILRSW